MWQSNKPNFDPTDFPSDETCARASIGMPREDSSGFSFEFYRFHLRGEKPTLYLDDENGLHKYIVSTYTDYYRRGEEPKSGLAKIVREEIPDVTIIEFEEEPKLLLPGDYYDYRYALNYALERFPKIGKEISRYICSGTWTMSFFCISDEEKKEIHAEWGEKQKRILSEFYRMFCKSLIDSNLSGGRVKSLTKKAGPLKIS